MNIKAEMHGFYLDFVMEICVKCSEEGNET